MGGGGGCGPVGAAPVCSGLCRSWAVESRTHTHPHPHADFIHSLTQVKVQTTVDISADPRLTEEVRRSVEKAKTEGFETPVEVTLNDGKRVVVNLRSVRLSLSLYALGQLRKFGGGGGRGCSGCSGRSGGGDGL